MAIYTCHDMIRDCRAGNHAGWSYLVTYYLPVLRTLLHQYYAGRAGDEQLIERVLLKLKSPQLPLYAANPSTEREWVCLLRQELLRIVELDKASDAASIPIDLETLTQALEPFTIIDRQFIWLETMGYKAESTALMMNLDTSSVTRARERAEEALRQHMDHWRRGLLLENGLALSLLAETSRGANCLPARAYLDTIDGRITWSHKKDYEFHLRQCWHCVDAFCRIREVDFALRGVKPLAEAEARPYHKLLGVPEPKKGLLQALFAR
ncbi:MAG: hypothetical protein HY820_45225 [Acidobacteria bacterium]|nr:hypothetical protein [Acidobacteriota bacterium]